MTDLGIYIPDKAGLIVLEDSGQAGTIEVTPAMIEAGWNAVDLLGPDSQGFGAAPDWLERVFIAMLEASSREA